MKSIKVIILCCVCSLSAYSQIDNKGKFSIEPVLAFSFEYNLHRFGLEYGTNVNYSILDRLGVQAGITSFQSMLEPKSYTISNCSYMIISLDVFGDIIKTSKGQRLRLALGGTYLKGALAYADWYTDSTPDNGIDDYIPRTYSVSKYSCFAINAKLTYIIPLNNRWNLSPYMGVYRPLTGELKGLSFELISVGCTTTYNF
jgi:hypothetical protein